MTDQEFLAMVREKWPSYVWEGHVTGQVRLSGPAYDFLREYVWIRDKGICQETGKTVFLEKGLWKTMHLAHVKSKGSGGSDLPSNVRALSLEAHYAEHQGKR